MNSLYSCKVLFCSFFLLFLFSLNNSNAQSTAAIKGTVLNHKQHGMWGINIHLLGTSIGTVTDQKGNYAINQLPAGSYTLEASAIGYESFTQKITLDPGQILHLNLTIKKVYYPLETIKIVANGNPYLDKKSTYVARMPLKRMDNPQVYNILPKELFKEQMATSLADILRNITGSSVPEKGDKGKIGMALRGFGLKTRTKDGMSSYTKTTVDPADIERVEIIRGPSATLFGGINTSYGGLVNIVTKKPYKRFGGNITYRYKGKNNINRLTFDLNTPVNQKRTLLFRLNVAGETGDNWRDAGFNKSLFAAPALSWEITKNISLNAYGEFYKGKATSPFYFAPDKASYHDVRDIPIDWQHSFINNAIYYHTGQYNFGVHLNAKLGSHWDADTKVSFSNNPIKGYTYSLRGLPNNLLYHDIKYSDQRHDAVEVQQNFHYHLKSGAWENKLLVGLDYYHYHGQEKASSVKIDTVNYTHPGANYEDNLTQNRVDAALPAGKQRNTSQHQDAYAGYFSDVISFRDRWFAMASLRVDHFHNAGKTDHLTHRVKDQFHQTSFSPKFGLVYQPVKDKIALFANYMTSFENLNGSDFAGHPFTPQKARQWEGGVKFHLLGKRLVSTLSAYRIKVNNMLRPDPINDQFEIQDGTELSKGIDFHLTYNPLPGFNLMAGYGYNSAKFVKAAADAQGLRPYKAGPKHTANIWISYRLVHGKWKGLGIAAGGSYGSHLYGIKKNLNFYVPGYTVLGASLFYQRRHFRIGVKFNNLTNEKYWDYRLNMHSPRSVVVNLTLKY